jgi:hypothetical protein
MSSPSSLMLPAVGSMRRSAVRPTVDLPQPDSPTRPRVSPRRMEKLTPSTAKTFPALRRRKPLRVLKYFLSSFTSRMAGSAQADGMGPACGRSDIRRSIRCVRVPAGDRVALPLLLIRRVFPAAPVVGQCTARREDAARRQVDERGNHSGDLLQRSLRGSETVAPEGKARNRRQEAAGIGM